MSIHTIIHIKMMDADQLQQTMVNLTFALKDIKKNTTHELWTRTKFGLMMLLANDLDLGKSLNDIKKPPNNE